MTGALSGRGVFLWLLGFFGVIMAMNVFFVVASVRSFSGEDEQKPYLQGVAYNQTLARRAVQKSLAWRADIAVTRLNRGQVRLDIALAHPDGTPVRGLTLQSELRHPSAQGRDRPAKLREMAPGRYEAIVSGISSGAWDLVADTGARQPPFEMTRRLWLP
jgi:nitrogen fixation protein FixH